MCPCSHTCKGCARVSGRGQPDCSRAFALPAATDGFHCSVSTGRIKCSADPCFALEQAYLRLPKLGGIPETPAGWFLTTFAREQKKHWGTEDISCTTSFSLAQTNTSPASAACSCWAVAKLSSSTLRASGLISWAVVPPYSPQRSLAACAHW